MNSQVGADFVRRQLALLAVLLDDRLQRAQLLLRRITSYKLQVTSYKLKVTSYKLQVTSYKLQVTSYKLQVTSYKLQVTSHKLQASPQMTPREVQRAWVEHWGCD